MNTSPAPGMISAPHDSAVTIEANNFQFKSLSNWAMNLFMGCAHGCRFCYVPDTSVNKQKKLLGAYGIKDPAMDWGNYVLVRPWDRQKFMVSLRKAEETPANKLKRDGNRAVILCSTTDPYQVIKNSDPEKRNRLEEAANEARITALEAIRDHSTLNVRILTRSPVAKNDFELFKSFGNRLLLGTSLPTLDDKLRNLYEPGVPHPKQRLKMLVAARKAGIHTFAAVAPVFPEVGYKGMLEVFEALKKAEPVTIFMEPVNLRYKVAERLKERADELGIEMDMTIYQDKKAWVEYALQSLRDAERAARATGQFHKLHLWPDHEELSRRSIIDAQENPEEFRAWLESWWNRVSEWPADTSARSRSR